MYMIRLNFRSKITLLISNILFYLQVEIKKIKYLSFFLKPFPFFYV